MNQNKVSNSENLNVDVQGNHAQIIREIGAASAVLLKNVQSALPLDGTLATKKYGIFGSDSASAPGYVDPCLYFFYAKLICSSRHSGPNSCGDRGCDVGTLGVGWGSGSANFPYLIAPLGTSNAEDDKSFGSFVFPSLT